MKPSNASKTAPLSTTSTSANHNDRTKGPTTVKTAQASKKASRTSNPHTATVQSSPDAAVAFEATRAEREAIPSEELLPMNVDVGASAQVALGAIGRIAEHSAKLRILPGATLAFESLRNCANGAAHAVSARAG